MEIEFTVKNIKKCLCPECPVQAESECAEGKRRIMLEIAYSSESGMYFEEDRVPGLYCATGKNICKDLDTSKECICDKCPVWNENELYQYDPGHYFCQDGKSIEICKDVG